MLTAYVKAGLLAYSIAACLRTVLHKLHHRYSHWELWKLGHELGWCNNVKVVTMAVNLKVTPLYTGPGFRSRPA